MSDLNERQSDTTNPQLIYCYRKGFAITSMVLGIFSILLFITFLFPMVFLILSSVVIFIAIFSPMVLLTLIALMFPYIFSVFAILLGIFSLKEPFRGKAITGIVTGGLGLFLTIWYI